ncbi:hypothetical protein DSLASN_37900 [Desulfoluna limicola]|uniref:Uncharacterized protein n=1 Tax=Desulfoluna limicola TaxID=2810562 RepID=A0ABM7PL76_9BACT|nr:hypothetical protein [Desulfoluna limicola]BCS98158.1 hypothetical protein DSLASN_37900 [Desulfoluna limicola]
MVQKGVKSVQLDNGLTLTMEDISRRISEDAFVVKALVSIDFEITEEDAQSVGLSLAELREALGSSRGRFEKVLERNFINEANKEAVYEGLTRSYLHTNLAYLSHADLQKGVIRRRLVEKRGRYWNYGA